MNITKSNPQAGKTQELGSNTSNPLGHVAPGDQQMVFTEALYDRAQAEADALMFFNKVDVFAKNVLTFDSFASKSEAIATLVAGGAGKNIAISVRGSAEAVVNEVATDAIEELINDLFNCPWFLADILLQHYPESCAEIRDYLDAVTDF